MERSFIQKENIQGHTSCHTTRAEPYDSQERLVNDARESKGHDSACDHSCLGRVLPNPFYSLLDSRLRLLSPKLIESFAYIVERRTKLLASEALQYNYRASQRRAEFLLTEIRQCVSCFVQSWAQSVLVELVESLAGSIESGTKLRAAELVDGLSGFVESGGKCVLAELVEAFADALDEFSEAHCDGVEWIVMLMRLWLRLAWEGCSKRDVV
jgi:hypothetical protein